MVEDSDSFKTTMAQEAIAMWQRFLLRYRGDNRTPNAHYCLGQLYAISDQTPTALGEYKLLATQFSSNSLAPYALLSSSKIKTNLMDYKGAQLDLNELLIRYPNAKVMDEAMLYLAEATMDSGGYKDAAEMFQRLYHLNINQEVRRQSAYGLGKCAYAQERFEEAVKWLEQTLTLIDDKNDKRLSQTCYMLGKAYIQTRQFAEASQALRKALAGKMANREYIQTMLELATAEMKREQHLTALDILESIPEARLSQDDAVEVMLARARLYRQIDVPASAISLLRRKIEFIAESRLRAMLSLELAECYLQNGEPTMARRELNDAIQYLPTGAESQRAAFLLARIAHLSGSDQQAESLCLDILKLNIQDETLKRQIYDLLGTIYTAQKAFDRAALAYAGLLEQSSVQ
jgi:TolA-binding protein